MKVPWPSAAPPLVLRASDIKVLSAGTPVWRIYFAGGPHPAAWNHFRAFGPVDARFDHHRLIRKQPVVQARAIYYAANDPITALAETFQKPRAIDRFANDPWLVGLTLIQDVQFLNLGGGFVTRVGASPAINSVSKSKSRAWSGYFYRHYPVAQGLLYPSSMWGKGRAYAMYERAQSAMPAMPIFNRSLGDPAMLPRLKKAASDLGFNLI